MLICYTITLVNNIIRNRTARRSPALIAGGRIFLAGGSGWLRNPDIAGLVTAGRTVDKAGHAAGRNGGDRAGAVTQPISPATAAAVQGRKDMSIRRIDVGPRMSDIVIHGNTVYLAGQVGAPGESVTSQTKAILATIDELLAKAGTDKTKSFRRSSGWPTCRPSRR